MKKRKKLLIIIPSGLALLCAGALGIYCAIEGFGGLISLVAKIDRTDVMQAQVYEAPDGTVLPYRIYVPENAGPARYPLVLYLHGAGQSGSDNRAQTRKNSVMQTLLSVENLAKYPCIVLAPQCPEDDWWASEDLVPVLMGLLEQTGAAYSIDPARIYITGLSMGGFGAWAMLAEYPGYFAAAVPICGGGNPDTAPLFKDVPIWAFHGARDAIVPVGRTREMVQALEAINGNVKYTEYPHERHRCWERAYREPELFPWLFAQVKSPAPPVEFVDMMHSASYMDSANACLDYRIYVPEGNQPAQGYPLVLFLHGAGQKGSDNRAQVQNNSLLQTLLGGENLTRYPCVIVAPQCPEGMRWVPGVGVYDLPDVTELLMGLLEQVCAAHPVDPARIYITGLSMGGYGTWGMVRAYPGYFAAAVPICGGRDRADDVELAPRLKDIPIWAFHGALDDDVPVECSRDMVEALEAVGGSVKYTEYPEEGHFIWARAYNEPELFPWLFAQSKE